MIKIFILSFLDQDIIFYFKNLEMLKYFLFFFPCIHYPLTETTYSSIIYSISKQNSTNQLLLMPTIKICEINWINCEFDETINIINEKSDVFSVNFDKEQIKYRPPVYDTYFSSGGVKLC